MQSVSMESDKMQIEPEQEVSEQSNTKKSADSSSFNVDTQQTISEEKIEEI